MRPHLATSRRRGEAYGMALIPTSKGVLGWKPDESSLPGAWVTNFPRQHLVVRALPFGDAVGAKGIEDEESDECEDNEEKEFWRLRIARGRTWPHRYSLAFLRGWVIHQRKMNTVTDR